MVDMESWWEYAKHPDFNVKWSIFSKDSPYEIPVEILEYLADDEDWVIRVEVASYSKTPVEILKHLVTNDAFGVVASVFQNPNCTEEIRILHYSYRKYGHLLK